MHYRQTRKVSFAFWHRRLSRRQKWVWRKTKWPASSPRAIRGMAGQKRGMRQTKGGPEPKRDQKKTPSMKKIIFHIIQPPQTKLGASTHIMIVPGMRGVITKVMDGHIRASGPICRGAQGHKMTQCVKNFIARDIRGKAGAPIGGHKNTMHIIAKGA